MDEDRLNQVAAEVLALRVMISAITELFPDQLSLRQSIERHATALLSPLPAETEEQKQFSALVKTKLNVLLTCKTV